MIPSTGPITHITVAPQAAGEQADEEHDRPRAGMAQDELVNAEPAEKDSGETCGQLLAVDLSKFQFIHGSRWRVPSKPDMLFACQSIPAA